MNKTEMPIMPLLFKSLDGKELFEGESMYVLTLESGSITRFILTEADRGWWKDAKMFSTREAAEQYKLANSPCLTLKEVTDIIYQGGNYVSKITDLAKQKLWK